MTSTLDNSEGRALRALAPGPGDLVTLSRRPDATVVRAGATVLKVHRRSARTRDLWARVALADALGEVFLRPLAPEVVRARGRLVTRWPVAEPLSPEAGDAPWEEAATLLAHLHRIDPAPAAGGGTIPAAGGADRLRVALERLRRRPASPAGRRVLSAAEALPPGARGHATRAHLVHGDFHLGQVVRTPAGLRLIDVDDVGLGDPAWDLARPAAWYAIGLLPGEMWSRFLQTYLAAGGATVPASDPWSVLDGPARAMVVQAAARAVVRDAGADRFDEVDRALLDTCDRIAQTSSGERA